MILNPYRFAAGEPLNTNLVSFWKLQEASGTRADSITASGNDLDDINTVGTNADSIVYTDSAEFNSIPLERLRKTDATQTGLAVTGSFTMSCWIDFGGSVSSNNHGLMGKYKSDGASERGFLLWYKATAPTKLGFILSTNGTDATQCDDATWSPSINTWYNIVARFDTDTNEMETFVDGVSRATQTFTGSVYDTPADFNLGYTGFGIGTATQYFKGSMEAVGFWDRALTDAEVTRLADETDVFYDQY